MLLSIGLFDCLCAFRRILIFDVFLLQAWVYFSVASRRIQVTRYIMYGNGRFIGFDHVNFFFV